MIRRFSDTDDLNNLPRDRELKCYMDCLLISSEMRSENSTSFNYVNIIEAMNRMPTYSQKILLHMSRGCIKFKKSQDGCENAYTLNVCLKTNDKEVCKCAFSACFAATIIILFFQHYIIYWHFEWNERTRNEPYIRATITNQTIFHTNILAWWFPMWTE